MQECWPSDQESSQCRATQPNRDEIFHTTFQLLWANLLNHWHLITKLFTAQLTALVLGMKWLRFGDLSILYIFMLFIWLLPSAAFIEFMGQARFLWKSLHCSTWWGWSIAGVPITFVKYVPNNMGSRIGKGLSNLWVECRDFFQCHNPKKTYLLGLLKII